MSHMVLFQESSAFYGSERSHMRSAPEDCMFCSPDPCQCRKSRRSKTTKPIVKVDLPAGKSTEEAWMDTPPTEDVHLPMTSEADLLMEYALFSLQDLLGRSQRDLYAGMIPDALTPKHHAAAWKARRDSWGS